MSKTLLSLLIVGVCCVAQGQVPNAPSATQTAPDAHKDATQRGMGLYLGSGMAADEHVALSTRQKFGFAAWNSFSPLTYPEVALIAGISQADNQQPTWGQGAEGFGKRYGAAFADQAINTMLSQAVLASMLKEDPRYFRRGHGTFGQRLGYSVSRMWITRRDDGTRTANVSVIMGAGMAAGISRIYYPSVERTAGKTLGDFGILLATDAAWNVFYEFWPDIRHGVFRK